MPRGYEAKRPRGKKRYGRAEGRGVHDAGPLGWAVAIHCGSASEGQFRKKDTLEVRAVGLGGRTADPGYVPRWSVRCMDVHKE